MSALANSEKFNEATLKLSCARSMVLALSIYQPSGERPSSEVLAEAMHGIFLLLEDATNTLATI